MPTHRVFHPTNAALSSLYTGVLTSGEIEAVIRRTPVCILPMGGTEPMGELGTMDVANACVWALANRISEEQKILVAPLLSYGHSTSYAAFPGCGTVKRNTMAAVLGDLLRPWVHQGFKAIVLIDGVKGNTASVKRALKRNGDSGARVLHLCWQGASEVMSFVSQHKKGRESYRAEYSLLSMAAYLDPALVRSVDGAEGRSGTYRMGTAQLGRWEKRGADPEQFRKAFPDAITSEIAAEFDPEFGKELFLRIVELLGEKTRVFVGEDHA